MLKNNLKNTLLLSLVMLALINSCTKENTTSSKISLISFGPSGVAHGDTISFIGTGLNQVTSVIMPVDTEVPSSSFITQTATLIELVVPVASTAGYVTLKTPQGDVVSKTVFGSSYIMSVTSFTPALAKPGTNITVNGNFLNYVKQVNFSQGLKVTQFVSQSISQIVVQVPPTAQTGGISLTDLATAPSLVDQDASGNTLVLTVSLPVVTSFSPSGVEQTANLTINGTDLDLVTEIDFAGGTSGFKVIPPFVSQLETQIVVTVPSAAITGVLTLTAPSGVKVTTIPLTVLEPAITTLPVGRNGSQIKIEGTNLNLVASILFPDGGTGTSVASSDFTNVATDGTSIIVTIPAPAIPGTLQLTTIHAFKVSVPSFKITLPVATAYSTTNPGSTMIISGHNLDLVSGIIFPGVMAPVTSFTFNSADSTISGTIPSTVVAPGTLQFILANGYSTGQSLGFGGCSTSFPGSLLFDFADASQAVWNMGSYDNLSGHTCNGQLTISPATLTSGGTNIQYDIGAVDWTGKTKLHIWMKVVVADPSTLNGAQIFTQPDWGWVSNGYWGQASTIFDGNWHEYVLPLSGTLTSMNRIGIQILSSSVDIQATVDLDDVWVE